MIYELKFTGWNENLKKVSFVRILRERGGMTFRSSKRVLESLLLNEDVSLELSDIETAEELKKETTKLGAKSQIVEVKQSKKELAIHH